VNKQLKLLPHLLFLAATGSEAMSLGTYSGKAFTGSPADTSAQTALEVQRDMGRLCLEADIFYADNKLDKSRVRVSIKRSASLVLQALYRIRSAVSVNEPIVRLDVRAACQLTTERRYLTLSELIPEP
jgi:hypothetical protein